MSTTQFDTASWTKHNDEWAVSVPFAAEAGDTITVMTRAGKQSEVTIVAQVGQKPWGFIWTIAPKEEKIPTGDPVPVGYYSKDNEFFYVKQTKDGERTYAMQMVVTTAADGSYRGKWTYVQGVVRELTTADSITEEAAKEFGKKYGVCVICARVLTDPVSVDMGIGPVCAKKIGV